MLLLLAKIEFSAKKSKFSTFAKGFIKKAKVVTKDFNFATLFDNFCFHKNTLFGTIFAKKEIFAEISFRPSLTYDEMGSLAEWLVSDRLCRSRVRFQHPPTQWNLRGGR